MEPLGFEVLMVIRVFHGAHYIRGGVECQEETREKSEGVIIERLVAVLADLTVDEIDLALATLHTLLVLIHGCIIYCATGCVNPSW